MNLGNFEKSVVAAGILFVSLQASATTITLDFSSLPSAQGWTYFEGFVPVSESTVFHVSGGTLYQDSTVPGVNAAYYKLDNVVDPSLPFTLTARARVLTGDQALAFYVAAAGQFAAINLSPTAIIDETTSSVLALLDNTVFHDYRMEGAFGTGYQLFIDNALIALGSFGAYGPNLLALGDSASFGSGQAEITEFSFQQTSVPEPATLFLVLSGIGILATTRFGGGAKGAS